MLTCSWGFISAPFIVTELGGGAVGSFGGGVVCLYWRVVQSDLYFKTSQKSGNNGLKLERSYNGGHFYRKSSASVPKLNESPSRGLLMEGLIIEV